MRQVLLSLCFLWGCSSFCFAQNNISVGFFTGASYYNGDLQQTRLELSEVHPAYGALVRYQFSKHLGLRWQYSKGTLSGDDANYQNLLIKKRNLHFQSNLQELSMVFEWSPTVFGEGDIVRARWYLAGGMSMFHFNPQAKYNDAWVDLQPLGTEGQGWSDAPSYALTQIAIPFGIGFQFKVSPRCMIGTELMFRHTFTDYLDDVSGVYPDLSIIANNQPMTAALSYRANELNSDLNGAPTGQQRGDSRKFDSYVFGGLTMSWRLVGGE